MVAGQKRIVAQVERRLALCAVEAARGRLLAAVLGRMARV
jgi:hypothetical protein